MIDFFGLTLEVISRQYKLEFCIQAKITELNEDIFNFIDFSLSYCFITAPICFPKSRYHLFYDIFIIKIW